MAVAYASLVSLMRVIHDLQHHPSPPISLDVRLVESITQHLTFFQNFLQAFSPDPPVADDDEEAADPLEIRIAAAAYAAEDAIESHIVESIQLLRNNAGPNNQNEENIIPNNLCQGLLKSVIEEMDSIKKVAVVKLVDAEKKNKVLVVIHDQVAMTNIPASVVRNETMAGSDDALLEIMEKLTGGRLDRQVIPIEGMGGIGKTFLARNIYEKTLIKEHFYTYAWATISQQYNTGEILCQLLSQATKTEKEKHSGKSVDELGSEIYKCLFGRRFLIVMDDVWSIDAWDKIQRFFPNNDTGSRVLMTTRISQLCSQLNNDYSLHMSFLDEASSWGLFSKTVFGEKSCPPELKNIGDEIVDNCRGLPLSIAVVGGLLKKMDGTRASWESMRDNLSSVVNMENQKHCLRLLKLSYNHLPVHLKSCFLYMGVFEEDDEIRVSRLVRLWISEGFLKPKDGEALETTARGFLHDLIDRNLILIHKLGSTGSIKSCKIHDLVRDMCLKEGQKEGFYHVIGQCNPSSPFQGMNTQRRVVIPRNISKKKKKVRRELRYMSYARSVICGNGVVSLSSSNLGLLSTLHANELNAIEDITCHVNLQYLAINRASFQQVSLFWNLQTLILNFTDDEKPVLVVEFWKMTQLRHIELKFGSLWLPDLPIDDTIVMENLHTLKGVSSLKCSEGLINRIPNIKKLKVSYDDEDDEYGFDNIKDMCRLESLSFGVYDVVENNNNKLTFPHSLKKLTLSMHHEFEWEDMLEKIGSLPFLEKLKLLYGCFRKGKWETVEGQFPCLKYLQLYWCGGLENWTAAKEGSNILPRLQHLSLFGLNDLKEIPCELGNIDTLKSIQLLWCGEGAVKSAKEMVDEQLDSQGKLCFHVDVQLIYGEKQQHLLSLAGPNFQVRE